ncbi:hopanoid biosynthesis associated radical SAM protein HpnH [Bradyrhizobium sp. LM3.2]
MAIPFFKEMRIGGYLIKQKLLGRKRYPLVLMLEPLFRCNLACVGCGKIDYPDAILNRRMSAQECWDAADECGAPMVAIPGGEPLIHKEIGEIVRGLVARKKFVSLCTNALLLEKKLDLFEPSPYLFFSVHLDGLKEHHDKAVSQKGVFDRAVSAIKAGQGPRLHRQRQRHHLRRPSGRGDCKIPRPHRRARCRRLDVAGLCL